MKTITDRDGDELTVMRVKPWQNARLASPEGYRPAAMGLTCRGEDFGVTVHLNLAQVESLIATLTEYKAGLE